MEPKDPFKGETYTYKSVDDDGIVHEIEMTTGQILDLNAGKPITYWVRDETIDVDDEGRTIERHSAVPPDEI
jgi:hypothetical protein